MEIHSQKKLHLKLSRLGYFCIIEETVSSTIDLAIDLEKKNIPGIIIANHQTMGRGRYGHSWLDEKNASILTTIVENDPFLRKIDPNLLAHLFLLSVRSTLSRITKNKNIKIKWPNDLVVNGKKIGGSLIDSVSKKSAVLISLGLNVQNARVACSSFLQSLSLKKIDRAKIIEDLLTNWKKDKELFEKKCRKNDLASYKESWKNNSYLFDKNIDLQRADGQRLSGTVIDTSLGKGLTLKSDKETFKITFNDYSPGSILILKK